MADYQWDSGAVKAVKNKELDKSYEENRAYYDQISKDMWGILVKVSGNESDLKHGDLVSAVYPLIWRDATTHAIMDEAGLGVAGDRGAAQWYTRFTQYITERYLKAQEQTS
jgi:hypothetical protein